MPHRRPLSPELAGVVELRGLSGSDAPAIRRAFLESVRGAPHAWHVSKAVFEECFSRLLLDALEKSETAVACLREDPEVVVGWASVQRVPERESRARGTLIVHPAKSVVHWVWVDDAYRGMGLAHALLERAGVPDPYAVGEARVVRQGRTSFQKEPVVEGSHRHNRAWFRKYRF